MSDTISNSQNSSLTSLLKDHQRSSVALIKPSGNHGDTLIHKGLKSKLNHLNTNYKEYDYYVENKTYQAIREVNESFWKMTDIIPFPIPYLDNPDLIILHGGAHVSDMWGQGIMIFEILLRKYPDTPIIIAPQTFWFKETNFESVVSKGSQPIHLFAREKYSYTILDNMSLPENVSIDIAPDTAFYLSEDQLSKYTCETPSNYYVSDYDLLAFRNDREGVVPNSHIKNITDARSVNKDISMMESFNKFVTLAHNADRIFTDRLHVAILGFLLEKETILYENAWYKNRGVYNYSLQKERSVDFAEILEC